MNDNQNLTTGNVPIKSIVFTLPLLTANLLQSFYGLVDMVVVDRIVGEDGLAAISNTPVISFITSSVCISITMGGTVLAVRYKEAKSECGQIKTIGTLFTISLIAAVLVTATGLSVYGPLLQILNVPVAAMEDTCGYMKIICFGIVSTFGYNAVRSIFKGWGDAKNPLYFVTVTTAVNIVLDLFLVGPFGVGTKGAACATIFLQGISFVTAVIHLKRKNFVLDFQLPYFSIKIHKLATILKVGPPTAVQMVVANLSYPLITGMLNQFGVSVAAASGVGLKINTFVGMPCWAIGQAIIAMVGQNIGAGDTERVRKTTKTGLCLNLFITLTMVLLVQAFGEWLILLSTPADPGMITEGILYLRICCSANSLIYAVTYTFNSFATGIGSANIVMINALLDVVIVRLPVSWLLAFPCDLGFPGMYIGQALSPLLLAVVGLLYFKGKGWENKRILRQHSRIYHTKI